MTIDEAANLLTIQPAEETSDWRTGIPALIEEVVTERIARAMRFCARVLDRVDPMQRISHVAPVASLRGAGYLPWRTRAEHQRSPNAATMGIGGANNVAVTVTPPVRRRAALLHDIPRLAEDLTVRLRREVRQ